MKTELFVYNNGAENSYLSEFINKISDFKIHDIKNLNMNFSDKLIFISNNLKEKKTKEFLNLISNQNKVNTTIFCAAKFIDKKIYKNIKFVSHPLLISTLKNYAKSKKINKISFLNISILNNTLVNSKNSKSVAITDTEEKILNILFYKNKVDKSYLEKKALNFSPNVESKSIHSHLVRIRKKFFEINADMIISSVESKYVILEKIKI